MLSIIPISLKQANTFIADKHRHNGPTVGHKFSIGLVDNDNHLIGVAICGRPVSRYLDDGLTLEINRLCTTGTANACSMLYGACRRAAKAMGYKKIITYTLQSEPGTSLKASGFICEGKAGGLNWNGTRKRAQAYPAEYKNRWVINFNGGDNVGNTDTKSQ